MEYAKTGTQNRATNARTIEGVEVPAVLSKDS
jgi:hypothetical protein